MTPLFHPSLVNPPLEDPCVYVDFLFSRRAFLFDLGSITSLPARKILRISHVFISHTHIDHFIGFDHLLRICLGREKQVHLFGPPGFIDQVAHRLASYSWNLVQNYDTDFSIVASEIHPGACGLTSEFHCRQGFKAEAVRSHLFENNLLHEEEGLFVRTALLDHKIPSLAFALEEKLHINIMKNRLDEMGLVVGAWLKGLKKAIQLGAPDDTLIPTQAGGLVQGNLLPLGSLKEATSIVAGQKICYVTDAGFTAENAEKIIDLVKGADYLFIEATFLELDAARAAERCHLTARQAGELARRAGVARVIPFQISPRYAGREEEILSELEQTWKRD
ncbi:MAG TPA: MBL fold metallo-hydrolase [Desulfuromonadaceae bacterium]|jgi:ribonuclease Z